MSKSKRGIRYDAEFKREAVLMLLSGERSATRLSEELGVSSWSLGQWKKDYLSARGEIAVDGGSRTAADVEQENISLRRELVALARQRDLLKKAIAICSEDAFKPMQAGDSR